MSKQEQKSKQIPQNIIDSLEHLLGQRIEKVQFEVNYFRHVNKKVYDISSYIVNNSYYVDLYNKNQLMYGYETVEDRRRHQEEFRKRVQMLMEQTYVTWHIGSLISNLISDDKKAILICQNIDSAKKQLKANSYLMKEDDMFTITFILSWNDVDNVFDLNDPSIFNTLKRYFYAA